tara:strand:+ start:84830 stop:85549 length:720 start_codon:yes stop_codon:yes gene_type:complete
MIKFFRRIRQKLVVENRASKYLLYAIGEIALVMIGILLALQVNSYYQYKQDRNLEHSLLIELQNNIKRDSIGIGHDVTKFEKIKKNAIYLDSILQNKLPYEPKIDSAFAIVSTFSIAESNYVPYDKIKSLKNGIMQNDSLFNSLSNYYNFSKQQADVDRYFEIAAYFRKDIYPKYFKGYRYGRIAIISDYQKILHSDEVKIALDYCLNDAFFYLRASKHRVEHSAELLQDITEELKRFE